MKRWCQSPALAGTTPSATPKQIDDFFLLAMLGVVLGGRICYLLFYGWTQIQSDPLYIFRVWEGGMSFHGGFFGVIIASFIYARRQGIGLDRLLDLGAAATPVGLGLGRLANFINGELYGRETYLPWAFLFPRISPVCAPSQPVYDSSSKGAAVRGHHYAVYRYKIRRPARGGDVSCLGLAGSG